MKLLKALAFVAVAAATPAVSHAKVEMKTAMDSIAYSVGTNWGTMMKTDDLNLNLDVLKQGMEDAMKGAKLALTDEQIASYFKQLSDMVQAKLGAAAKAEGAKFLAENGKRKGVSTTPSGLQYEVVTPGKADGKKPTATSKVKVHYSGTLINGKKFDSSYDRNEPTEFELNRVIPGWTEGLQLIKEGGKATLYIPAKLAYGEQGVPGIPPNSPLIFDVELIQVK